MPINLPAPSLFLGYILTGYRTAFFKIGNIYGTKKIKHDGCCDIETFSDLKQYSRDNSDSPLFNFFFF